MTYVSLNSYSNRSLRGAKNATLHILATLVVTFIAPNPLAAIDIIWNFNAAASQTQTFDPNAAGLQSLIGFVSAYYEDVIEDPHVLRINYWYEDLPDCITGDHDLVSQGGSPHRELEANIRIDSTRTGVCPEPWFIDPTPLDNAEFNMGQRLWRDLTPTQQANSFSDFGTGVPATFEVGFLGEAISGGAAVGRRDMLSVIMHEVGHSLGLSNANNATQNQTPDGDYDFPPALVFGQSLAAAVAPSNNIGHLDDPDALMFPQIGPNRRKLPSHTDLFAMASAHAYADLDVPRREFYGGGNWNHDGNWSGNSRPSSDDDVFVRNHGRALASHLTGMASARNLDVCEGASVDTRSFLLDVANRVRISDLTSAIYVGNGGELEALAIDVGSDALLSVDGGLVDTNVLTLTQGSIFTALQGSAGTVDVLSRLTNNATIRAVGGGTLTFVSTSAFVWDLDGTSNSGIVEAVLGNLDFASGSLTDSFGGEMRIGNGANVRTLTIAQGWTLESGGRILMNGGAISPQRAVLSGGAMTAMAGTIQASAGQNWIDAPAILGGTLITNTPNGGVLEFNGNLTVNGGQFNSAGTGATVFDGITSYAGGVVTFTGRLSQNGAATVNEPTTIQGDTFNFDGLEFAPAPWRLNDDLTLNVMALDDGGGAIDSALTIQGGNSQLTVNTPAPWSHGGTITINASPISSSTSIAGQAFTASGVVNINGRTRFASPTRLTGTMNLVTTSSRFTFGASSATGLNRLEGGTIQGSGGRIEASGNTSLSGFGTISTGIDFDTGTELLADTGTLNLTGNVLGLGIIGTAAGNGTLNVSTAWDTGIADALVLKGGIVTGGGITNNGTTRGNGTITSANFVNNSLVEGMAGTLVLNPTVFPDLDGSSNDGELRAFTGNISIPGNPNPGVSFAGSMSVGNARNISLPVSQVTYMGMLNLTGGEFSALQWRHLGQLNVTGANSSRIRVWSLGGSFENGSISTINGPLALTGDFRVYNGATLSGTGQLLVDNASQLRVDNNAAINVAVANLGRFYIDTAPASATVAGFSQAASGVYEAEIDGVTAGSQYDQLLVTGNAVLGGHLEIQLNQNGGTYADPTVAGDLHVFALINAGSLSGDFDNVTYGGSTLFPEFAVGPGGDFVSLAACGLFRAVDYSTNGLQLINYRAIRGDANGDGLVDGTDFNIWNANKFTTGTTWSQGDFNCNGTTDGSDFNLWNSNKFTGSGLPLRAGGDSSAGMRSSDLSSANVVPEPGWLLFLLLPLAARWRV